MNWHICFGSRAKVRAIDLIFDSISAPSRDHYRYIPRSSNISVVPDDLAFLLQSGIVLVVDDDNSALGRNNSMAVTICYGAASALHVEVCYRHMKFHFVDPGDAYPLSTQQSAVQQLSLHHRPRRSPQGPYLHLQDGNSARISE